MSRRRHTFTLLGATAASALAVLLVCSVSRAGHCRDGGATAPEQTAGAKPVPSTTKDAPPAAAPHSEGGPADAGAAAPFRKALPQRPHQPMWAPTTTPTIAKLTPGTGLAGVAIKTKVPSGLSAGAVAVTVNPIAGAAATSSFKVN